MPEVSPKVSMSVNVIALITMVIGGGVAYGKVQANLDENAKTIERLNALLESRAVQVADLQIVNARRDEQFGAILRDVTYLRAAIDKLNDRLEKSK